MNKSFKGAILLTIAAFIWGTAFVAQSQGMDHIGPFTFTAIRNFIGTLVLLPVLYIVSKTRKKLQVETETVKNRDYIKGGIVCGIILFFASSSQQYGIQFTTAGKAGFLTALYIVIVPIIGIFMKKYPPAKVWVSVLIAGVGTYLLSVQGDFTIGIGDLYVLLCAVIFSFHIIAIDHYSPKTDAIKLSCVQFLVAGTISLIVAFIVENPEISGIIDASIPLLYTGVMSSGIAFTLQIVGQRNTPPSVASLVMSLESVFAMIAGCLILNEVLTVRESFGCALVFTAVILAQLPSFKKKTQENKI